MSNTYYAVLSANIDMEGQELPSKSYNNDRFYGIFNGLGHSIINPTVNSNGGIFGGLHNSKIENFALIDVKITKTYSSYALLTGYLYPASTVSNVYVKTAINQLTYYRGLFYSAKNGKLSNIVAHLEYGSVNTSDNKFVFGVSDEEGLLNRPSYVYAIGNATAYSGISNGKTDSDASLNYDAETSDIVYNTAKDFYTAKKSEITAENGFSKYWVANDKALFFGDIFICGLNEKQQEKINLATYTYKNDVWTSATYNISDFFDFNPISVMINGVIVNTPVNGEFDLSSYQQGSELEISAIDNQGDITVQPVFLVSHEIDTADKFLAFISSWDSTTKNITKNYYAVLTADIDGSTASNAKHGLGQCSGQYISNRFYGVFDGKGHTVSNIVINNSCLFGSLQNSNGIASIKNVAFINLQATSAAVLLGDSYSGIVENVYIKSSLLNRTGNGGAISKVGNVEVSNCIFDIEYGGNWDGTETSYAINGDATALSSKINNVYALGNAQYVQMGSTDTPYASGMLAKAVAENAVEITAQNGFNECWRVTNVNSTTTIYFGNNIVDTYTA